MGEARCTQHRNKDLRVAELAGEPVDNHRHAVAGIIDEQLLARRVALAHRHRQPPFPAAIKLAKARVAIAVRLARDVFLPHDRQRDVLALQRAMHFRPVRLPAFAMALLAAGTGEQLRLKRAVSETVRQRPVQPGRCQPLKRQPNRRGCNPNPPPNLAHRQAGRLQSDHVAHLAHGYPLAWHPSPSLLTSKAGTLKKPEEAPSPGRHHFGTVGDIIPEWRATSNRNGGRDHFGIFEGSNRSRGVDACRSNRSRGVDACRCCGAGPI